MPSEVSRLQDCLSTDELQSLLKALGFPKILFKKNLPKSFLEKSHIRVKELIEFCDLRYFHRDLHYTVNLKPAAYNANSLKKSLHLVGTKMLTFTDLENIRLAFETFEDYDQRGMTTSVWTILKALKLCGRVASPLKIMNKLRHLQPTHKVEGRIQFYEFLDLLALCQMHRQQDQDDDEDAEKAAPTAKNHRDLYQMDEFQYLVIPKEKKLWGLLNEQYRQEELRYDKPKLVSEIFKEQPINPDEFQLQVFLLNCTKKLKIILANDPAIYGRLPGEVVEFVNPELCNIRLMVTTLVLLAHKEYDMTRKRLKESTRQIMLSKVGHANLKPRKKPPPRSTISHKSMKTLTDGPPAWAQKIVDSPRHSATTTTAPSYYSAPIHGVSTKEKVKVRPQSCPPVVSSTLRAELNAKLNDVKFDVSTQKERHNIRIQNQLSTYLPDNYEEVLARLRQPPKTPNQKKYRRKHPKPIPSPNVIKRLSHPGPLLPQHHVMHCDATSSGLGGDNYAMTLQKHGYRLNREIVTVRKASPSASCVVIKPRKKKKKQPQEPRPFEEELNRTAWQAHRKRGIRRDACLLERLLVEHDTDSPTQDETTTNENIKPNASVVDVKSSLKIVAEEQKKEPKLERPPVRRRRHIKPPFPLSRIDETPPTDSLLSDMNRSDARLDQVLTLLKEDCAKIFLDPDSLDSSRREMSSNDEMEDDEDEPYRRQDYERFSPSPSSSQTSLEITDFEKFVQDDDNLTVTMEDLSLTTLTEGSNSDLRRMRKSFKRINRRLSSVLSNRDVIQHDIMPH